MRYGVLFVSLTLAFAAAADPAAPQWYKGVTHVHSLWSDGDMSPDLVAAWYKDHGYHFMCFTDHNVLQEGERFISIVPDTKLSPERVEMIRARFGDDWPDIKTEGGKSRMRLKTHAELSAYFNEPGKFLLVQAEEITSLGGAPHVNGLNLREPIVGKKGEVADLLNRYLDAVHAQREQFGIPMVAHVNHLNWSDGVTTEEMLAARRLRFFEIYNGHPGVRQWGSPDRGMPGNDRHWDVILSLRMAAEPDFILYAFATDDSHEYFEWGGDKVNPGRGWIMVRAEQLDANSLIEAIERADFYASTGVTLNDVQCDGASLRVDIAAEPGVTYTTQFIGTRKGFNPESTEFKNAQGETPDTASRVYSGDIGVVLLETAANPAVYPFTGDELYVRAKVVSSKPQENPVREGDPQIAWVQPVRVAR
ncbi:MAG: histidinol-phosphatase [Candidatus Hydrogenedentes bacterium]|nr:histidinol-phosphatase [Candidatus Hydrogenedentota bacterium]